MSPSDFVTRGQALVDSGQYQEAVKVCRLGLLGRPTTVDGRVVLGRALLALKRYDEVLAEMRVALELDHASLPAQLLQGEAMLRKGDGVGAAEVFVALRDRGGADPRLPGLLAEATQLAGRAAPSKPSAIAPAAADPRAFPVDPTKHYPAHQTGGPDGEAADGLDDAVGEFTRPTSVAAPSTGRPAPAPVSRRVPASRPQTPSPAVLAVGDRSGTVEVDPEVEGIDVGASEDEFGDLAAPPTARGPGARGPGARGAKRPVAAAARPARPSAEPARRAPAPRPQPKEEISTVELDDDEMIDVSETLSPDAGIRAPRAPGRKAPGPGTAVRNAVRMPSGPIDQVSAQVSAQVSGPVSAQAPAPIPAAPAPGHLASLIASQPHVMSVVPQQTVRGVAAASMPTAAAMPMPPQTYPAQDYAMPPTPGGFPAAPGIPAPGGGMLGAMPPQGGYSPPVEPPGFGVPSLVPPGGYVPPQPGAPPHAGAYPVAGAAGGYAGQGTPPHGGYPGQGGYAAPPVATAPPLAATQIADPGYGAVSAASHAAANRPTIAIGHGPATPAWADPMGQPSGPVAARPAVAPVEEPPRRPREPEPRVQEYREPSAAEPSSKVMRAGTRRGRSRWMLLAWVVIGAAVIGGGVFAGFQIRALRLGKQIVAARDRAVDLAKADTWAGWLGARDSLQGIAQASPTADNRAAVARARAMLAFEFGAPVAEAAAAVAALDGTSAHDLDVAAAYLALARSDAKAARDAADRAKASGPADPAALYVSGQAALLAGDLKLAVDDLRAAHGREARPLYAVALARALAASSAWDEAISTVSAVADHPAAVIARGVLLSASGRLGAQATQLRGQLQKVIAEGQKPAEPRLASPTQVVFAQLALARVDFARGDSGAAHADYRAAIDQHVDDQRFAEEISDTLYAIGELDAAATAAQLTTKAWPASRRARTTLAQVWLEQGKPVRALEVFTATPDAAGWPKGQVVRGLARLAAGDVDGARADFDVVLKKLPGFEPALVGRTWLGLAVGEVDEARRRIEPKFQAKTATPALATAYAAVLRAAGEQAKARPVLERAVVGAPGPEGARAHLELARVLRDLGDLRAARAAYAEASRTGNHDARLESGVLLIEDGDPAGGRATLEKLLSAAQGEPSAALLLETARARALLGDHAGAAALLASAEKAAGVLRWQLDRERGRLALRRGDAAGAADALERALAECGGDLDTFLLAADTVAADGKLSALAQRLKALAPTRLKGQPELEIIDGKLALAAGYAALDAGRADEAQRAWAAAEKSYDAANTALTTMGASQRRRAQPAFGLGAVLYAKKDDPNAKGMLELVYARDPTLYTAYLFGAEIARAGSAANAKQLALEYAQKAAQYNPESIDAWLLVGDLAAAQKPARRDLLDAAIARVEAMAPGIDALRRLQAMR